MSEFRRRLMMQQNEEGGIPVGCTRCLYLESFRENNVGQSIDTEYKVHDTDIISLKFSTDTGQSDFVLYGWRRTGLATDGYHIYILASYNRIGLGVGNTAAGLVPTNINTIYTLVIDCFKKRVTVDSLDKTSALNANWEKPFYNGDSAFNAFLFTGNNIGTPWSGSNSRIYDYWVKDKDGNYIQHLVPILDKEGVPCMYDVVKRKYHYNQRANTENFRYELL